MKAVDFKRPRTGRPTVAERRAADALAREVAEWFQHENPTTLREKKMVELCKTYWEARGASLGDTVRASFWDSVNTSADRVKDLPAWMKAGLIIDGEHFEGGIVRTKETK